MAKSTADTVEQLTSRLNEQASEVAALRAALDVQFIRIAQIQLELDRLPRADGRANHEPLRAPRWQAMRVVFSVPPHNRRQRRHD